MNLFNQICHKVSNKHYFQQLMLKQQQNFDIHPYKIDKIYSQTAKKYTNKSQTNILLQINYKNKIISGTKMNEKYLFGLLSTQINWNHLSSIFFDKSPEFLKFQFLNIIKIKKRVTWSNQQDELLVKTLQYEGIGKWNQISKSLYFQSNGNIFKTPKHCRERWLNHLDNNKNKGIWSTQQDYKIFSYVKQYGGKWSKIVQILNHTRTQHMVKNRFNSLLTKYRKNKKQKDIQTIDKILKILNNLMNNHINEKDNIEYFHNRTLQNQYIKTHPPQQHQNQQLSQLNKLSLRQLPSFQTKTSESFQSTPTENPIFSQGAFSPIYGSKNSINYEELKIKLKSNVDVLSMNNQDVDDKQILFMFQHQKAEKYLCKIKQVHIIIKN